MAREDLVYGSAPDGELLRRYHEDGDVRARQALIERHIGFVRRLAQRYAHRGETIDDLTQVGCVGLIKAIDRFDGQYKVTLATYAAPNVLGEIKRHFRDKGWSVRVPRDVQELNVKLGRVVDELTGKLGRSPSVEELAKATESTTEQVVEALDSSRAYNTVSLSAPGGDDSDEDGGDPLEHLGDEDQGFELAEERQLLREGFKELGERERKILHMRFFLGMTQSEIAERIGISQMHVSRLIRQSIDDVRERLDVDEVELSQAHSAGCRPARRSRTRARGGRGARGKAAATGSRAA
ncbi:MAG TPA: SigB/SigF/SigG family RNA polymerase sigma factor [Thermoleophilaceae bacterium]|nr:SigB/SigF/SigG family RNA polymerase sigma factor [Thermoleophilaceae bacterium]